MKNSLKQEIFSRKKQILLQKGQYYFVQYEGVLGHFATIDHLHDDVVLLLRPESFRVLLSCANWGFYYLTLAGISKFTYERKKGKYSGRSGKMTPSCKWPIPDYFRFTKTNEEIRPLMTVSEEPSKH